MQTFQCYPFEHKGCGGNENSYPTSSACVSDCVLSSLLIWKHWIHKSVFSGLLQLCHAVTAGQEIRWTVVQLWDVRNDVSTRYEALSKGNLWIFVGHITTTTPGPKLDDSGCPKGYTCQMGAFYGICCQENLTSTEAFPPKSQSLSLQIGIMRHSNQSAKTKSRRRRDS